MRLLTFVSIGCAIFPPFIPNETLAGQVRLVNNTWDSVCWVDIASGLDAPNTPYRRQSPVPPGVVATVTDRLCYRRPGNPSDCNSPATNWNCASQIVGGIYDFDLD